MAGITVAIAQQNFDIWLDAYQKIASGQSYEITEAGGARRLTRANLTEVQNQLEYWDRKLKALSGGSIIVRGVTPLD